MSEIRLREEEEATVGEVTETRKDECSDNKHMVELCGKRKRSEDEEKVVVVKEDNESLKTPTGPEHRIPQSGECPQLPRRREYSSETRIVAVRNQDTWVGREARWAQNHLKHHEYSLLELSGFGQ